MSWFKASLSQYAQDALSQAQASIDRALEIEPAQDPLSGSAPVPKPKPKKPRTPPPSRRSETVRSADRARISDKPRSSEKPTAAADNWTSWGASTVNNIFENSFSSPGEESIQKRTPPTRKKSNALKLGGHKRTSPTNNLRGDKSPKPSSRRTDRQSQKTCSTTGLNLVEININDPPVETEDLLKTHKDLNEDVGTEEPISTPISEQELSSTKQLEADHEPSEKPINDALLNENEFTATSLIPTPLMNVSSSGTLKSVSSSGSLQTMENSESVPPADKANDSLRAGDVPDKDPTTPTLSTCSSSSALSKSLMVNSSSSNSSEQSAAMSFCTITNEPIQQLVVDVVDEVSEDCVSVPSPERGGWSEDEIDEIDVDKASSDQDSRSSFEVTEHKRCLSIGSTASSSILMLQSPYDTTDGDKSDKSDIKSDKSDEKSDEDSMKTPTDLPAPPTPTLELAHQTIVEEVPASSVPARIITSPTHSDQSDLMVISEPDTASNNELMKLKEILHAREQRLFRMNHEYVQVQDELQSERQRSHNLEQNLNLLSQKHTVSVERLEDELAAMDDLKNHLEEEIQSMRNLGDINELKCELDEKDQLIEELTMEGEKLAQSSFNSSNNVKKLRQKEKEDEKIIKDQSEKIESLSREIEQLKGKMKDQQATVHENEQNISELNSIISSQSEELSNARTKLENCESENLALKTKVDGFQLEINSLRDRNAQAESRANQETLSANIKAKEQAQAAVEQLQASTDLTIKQLNSQIEEQQEVIGRLEQQAVWREQRQRDQIQELHLRVEDADGRNQDISTSITASTQPLLRQIQLFKESLANQQANWERIENELKDKLDQARSELSGSEMEKRDLSDRLQVTKNKVSTLQTQVDNTRAERNELEVTLEVVQNKLSILEEERKKDTNKSDSIKSQFVQSLEESQKECDHLREELLRMQSYVRDLESNKSVMSEVEDIASRSSTPPIEFTSQTNILERSLFGSSTPMSPTQSIPSHSSYLMEKMASQLKQSQSELISYQEQIRSLSLSKASLSAEITNVSKKCGELEQKIVDLPLIKKENKELQTRYDTLLQMYGEKAEEVHELQLDLTDVREAYKAQIEQLLAKVIR
ncbi:TATA element modulatory factor-like [Bolinopsis microptera]|uniref:TATA element modulatory factor-like n=1 Tax=Bolinopsis microptera TaxID=2820187 RepID=UPI003079EB12